MILREITDNYYMDYALRNMVVGELVGKTSRVDSLQKGQFIISHWSGFGWTTISQGENKNPFYTKQVINKKY